MGESRNRPKNGIGRATDTGSVASRKRVYISQADVPTYSLADALRVPQAIADNYAFRPAAPLDVAAAMKMQPTSGTFRAQTGAAIAYGLTNGGYNAPTIEVQPLARRILEPTEDADDVEAQREAVLKPRVLREFLTKYDKAKMPREEIAGNVLVAMRVPREAVPRTLKLITENPQAVGFLRDINGVTYISLQATYLDNKAQSVASDEDQGSIGEEPTLASQDAAAASQTAVNLEKPTGDNRRVFITHGKNKAFIEPLKEG